MARNSAVAADVLPAVVEMINDFFREHLNEEHAVLCRKLAGSWLGCGRRRW